MRTAILLVLGGVSPMLADEIDAQPATLNAAKESGRLKSRFLQRRQADAQTVNTAPKADIARYQKSIAAVLNNSCLACHGPERSEGRLRVDQLDPNLLTGADVGRWREIYNVLSNSEMPPDDEPDYALADADRGGIVEWLSGELRKASIARRNNTRHTSFRRLTKYEYDNALQDLLGLPYSLADRLPPETVSKDGFKNSSGMLQMSVMQFETYRGIALKALQQATVTGKRPQPVTYTISMQQQLSKSAKGKKLSQASKNFIRTSRQPYLLNRETDNAMQLSRRGGIKVQPETDGAADKPPAVSPVVLGLPRSNVLELNLDRFLPDNGTMRVSIRAARSTNKANEYASLRLDFGAHTSNNAQFSNTVSRRDIPVTAPAGKPEFVHFDIPLSNIQRNPFRKLKTAFPRRDELLKIRNVSNASSREEPLHVLIDYIEISAPYFAQWPPDTHTSIFFASENQDDEQVYAREVLARFTRRAWRRPVTSGELDRLIKLFDAYRPQFENFEGAMVEVLATVLAAPEFLYLTQQVSDQAPASTVSDIELASRLSFFLWSSIPDEELLGLAAQEKLHEPATLAAQVQRMLADPRSRRFAENFAGQWLGLDGLNAVSHVPAGALKAAMREEPIALFSHVLNTNSSVLDFIHADYVMVNEQLARHYGISGVYGPHFRKVAVGPQANRGGVLTNAAVLAMNSEGKDSHPLKRGVWMLERVLNDPPPPPPPDVPEVDLTDPEIARMSLKERIADHRNKPACASCHSRIDPWGIAFENYDALGAFRTQIDRKPVEATSELFNKQTLQGMNGLKRYLLTDRQDQFARSMVYKMTAYALGRPLSFSDHAVLDSVTARFRQRGDRLADLVNLITTSALFHAK